MSSGKSTSLRRTMLYRLLWVFRFALVAMAIMVGLWGYRAQQAITSRDIDFVVFFPRLGQRKVLGRVGLVAGHWQSDSGAVCRNGLREVEINLIVTYRAANVLRYMGYQVDIWPEFGEGLSNYRAKALISIHTDSCLHDRSGFKVARAAQSVIPLIEDELVHHLVEAYSAHTGLEEDPGTITGDMTSYHAFYKVAAETPAAIIELGYMGGDQRLLINHSGRAARGLAAGIAAFLESIASES
jgi:N-acetylmuramoyl-L-alanine amidase